MKTLVTGSGGFIGGHLVKALIDKGIDVVAVDIKPVEQWYQYFRNAWNYQLDLRTIGACRKAVNGKVDTIYNLAADMGGMGFIENNKALCMMSVLINTHLLQAAREAGVRRYFYSSSACVYNADKQRDPNVTALKEEDAYPAMPEDGYGWEKLFSERMCRHYREDFGLETRIARYHNVYGPCFDDQTEVLTENGWVLFRDLPENARIASRTRDGSVEYLAPVARQGYKYSGLMYQIESSHADVSVTQDHSLFVSSRTTVAGKPALAPLQLIKAKDAKWGAARLVFSCAGKWGGVETMTHQLPECRKANGALIGACRSIPMPDWLSFAGWYLSEGSSWITPSNHTVCVTQSKPGNRKQILKLIAALGFKTQEQGRDIKVSSKQLFDAVQCFGQGAHSKRIPRDLLNLSPSLLMNLYESLMLGDGREDGGTYTSASKQLADDVQELALRLGKRAWVKSDGPVFRVNICDRQSICTKRHHRTTRQVFGEMVYDVTLPKNHVLMVRRNGKPMWSGNCGTFDGGREKAPAAICRKVIEAKLSGKHEIEIWGDGKQTRSFMYIDDCIEGTQKIMGSDFTEPINLGSSELVSINDLVTIIARIAGLDFLDRKYNLEAPKGVNGRNSDNTKISNLLGWEPSTRLATGLATTYAWIYDQMKQTRYGAA